MIRLQTIHEPAKTLTPAAQRALLDDIVALNLQLSSTEQFRANWAARSSSFMADTHTLVLAYDGDELVGHVSGKHLDIDGIEVCYIDTFTAHPRRHDSGLGSRLALSIAASALRRSRGRAVVFAARTMVPSLVGRVRDCYGQDNFFPSLDPLQSPAPRELAKLAEGLAAKLWPECEFSVETGVLEGAYGGRFLPPQTSRCSAAQAHFDRHVDFERGDAVVVLMWFRREALSAFLRVLPGLVLPSLHKRKRNRSRSNMPTTTSRTSGSTAEL